jgi:CxxC motif-containing protein (DUF1111 family)
MIKKLTLLLPALLLGCAECAPVDGHGPIAPDISAPLGEIIPSASAEQQATFDRGREVALHRFTRAEGLGPAFNITFCAGCHEKPAFGGSAGLYRNFFLSGVITDQGAFFPGLSAGAAGGVIRMFQYGPDPDGTEISRPAVPAETNVVAQRNPIPFFGVGLLAELPGEEIEKRADPDDEDGDGISGRTNSDRGFVGRFGRKSQTVSIEGFIRGPLFNHLGVTTDPLDNEQRAALPVDSSDQGANDDGPTLGALDDLARAMMKRAQAAAPDGPLVDDDDAPDPELSTDDLFDLVSFAMLLAAPEVEPLTPQTRRGLELFDAIGCNKCHTPRLEGPRGPLPVYSDLLIHDMGPDLADGLRAGEALGSEFRTQPLWGIAAVGPFLHDGRAATLEEAIRWHGGEALAIRQRYEALSDGEREDITEFLLSLGGRDQVSRGLIPPDEPTPAVGEYGGPFRDLEGQDATDFEAGRLLFDAEFNISDGAGAPRFNGDSCRACHFEPVFGGAGPRGVNVMRHGILNEAGEFTPPSVGTILHKQTARFLEDEANIPQTDANIFEHRNTPHLFGLGLLEAVPESTITAQADPDDLDGDGISGRLSVVDGGRLGRFGWKAQVPDVEEFVRDAVFAELGMTLPLENGLTFGRAVDNDDVPDPELTLDDARNLVAYLELLGPPPRQDFTDDAVVEQGEALMETVGCTACHTARFDTPLGAIEPYTDMLLHETLPVGAAGIEDTSANMREFRTAPLWGISQTAPYMHDGAADTLAEAIAQHDGEAAGSRDDFDALSDAEQAALIRFLETL